MQQLIGGMWKFAAVALALVPGIFGVVHWMVEAKTEALVQRLIRVEHELDKGERFTAYDGDVLKTNLTSHIELHAREVIQLRDTIDKIRFDDATCKANVLNLAQRTARIEDRVYTMDIKPKAGRYRNAPYQMPIEPYIEAWPAGLYKDFN